MSAVTEAVSVEAAAEAMQPSMTALEFFAKWTTSQVRERAGSQEHFIDLCRVLGEKTPNEADPTGEWYAFDKGAHKIEGGEGWADVWKRDHFGWEYKGKKKDLGEAYRQLNEYRESLGNPPLLVVSDMDKFEVHTNFTGTKKDVHRFDLESFRTDFKRVKEILAAIFREPERLKPTETRRQITERAASRFAEISGRLQQRGHAPEEVAHFLNKLLFCFFAEDVGLLPKELLTRLLESLRKTPPKLGEAQLRELFRVMSFEGGLFGTEVIEWFNGGLFDTEQVLPLTSEDLAILVEASKLDWSNVEPAILGTLFERGLDPGKRRQLGAHYTDVDAIRDVIEPVVMVPLRRELEAMKDRVRELLAAGRKPNPRAKAENDPERVFKAFLERLRTMKVLDPACGSGNFLYVALRAVKDLESQAIFWAWKTIPGYTQDFPGVGPQIVHGLEINGYAADLAQVTIWIGHIQWMLANGYGYSTRPVLKKLETIECRDAVLDCTDPARPRPAEWPKAEFIVGNPPFAGGKKIRAALGDEYVEALFRAWEGEVPREADYVCYWHEKAREMITRGRTKRAGLLATQGIRSGANRKVLERVKDTGDIFMAWSDREWVVEGAAVRVSIIGQDDGSEKERRIDGKVVAVIHADLTGGAASTFDATRVPRLKENLHVAFMGDTKGGPFDVSGLTGRQLLLGRGNPHGRPNSDVVLPWINGLDVTRRPRDMFIVDFGVDMAEKDAALYERPFEWIRDRVAPVRAQNKRRSYRERWWLHVEPRPAMRSALAPLMRFIVTPRVGRHRLFVFRARPTLPDSQLIVVARDDEYALGVLHSRVHEQWTLALCSWLGVGNDPRYTPTTTFETFPFPWPLSTPEGALTPEQRAHRDAITAAAKMLDERRRHWLNPPDLVREEPDVLPHLPPRLVPRDEEAAKAMSNRTLTKLYNERPQWLLDLHRTLDEAVFAAYGWPADLSEDDVLGRLLALNLAREPT